MTTRMRENEIERGSALEDLRFRLVRRRRHEHGHARTLSCAFAVKGNAAAARYTRTRGPQVDFLEATDAHAHRRESIPCR